jgi:PAS domain S-box-containing protein/diguanylate cyclase (GGDEF)-like protein
LKFNEIINPAQKLMDKLPFKMKMIVSFSVLFILLIAPAFIIHKEKYKEHKIYSMQLSSIKYISGIQNTIKDVQIHRGLVNAYINGNSSYKNKILKIESDIRKDILDLVKINKKDRLLNHNKNFVDAFGIIHTLKLKNISKTDSADELFDEHSKVIKLLIKSIQDIANQKQLSSSSDFRVNFIATLIDNKLLNLQENVAKIRGIVAGCFTRHSITKTQKAKILKLYTIVKSLQRSILDNEVISPLDEYMMLQKETIVSTKKVDSLLSIIDKNILTNEDLNYDAQSFFTEATKVLSQQDKLYELFINSYKNNVMKIDNDMAYNFAIWFGIMTTILMLALYLSAGFYNSVVNSLYKLKKASKLIANGKTNIHIKSDTNDEIGEALTAFNDMSKILNQNITFLDGYKTAIDETSIVSKTDPKGVITYVNKKFCEVSGYSKKDIIGRSQNIVRHPDMPKETFKELWDTIVSKKVWHGVVKNLAKNGKTYIVDTSIIPILDQNGEVVEFIGVSHDITELEKSKEEIKKQQVDMLTGVSNQNQLIKDLNFAKHPTLIYLNIDDFASLNDFYGNTMGNNVLIFIANILKESKKELKAKLYKLYSDEFILYIDDKNLEEAEALKIAKSLAKFIESESVNCDDTSCVSITLSGGISSFHTTDNFQNLSTYANIARRVAKKENKKFMIFNKDMNQESDYEENIKWINKIKEAIEDDRLIPFYQPIIDNKSGAITKYETLIRLIEKDGKVISPFFFLDIAKKAKLYTKITKIVIDKSFETFKNLTHYEFSLNLTVEDVYDEEISAYILDRLSKFPNPKQVIFELTESESIQDYDRVNEFFSKIKSYGSRLAIDDFGSGYANFEHIIALKADFIKIDGSLIKNITTDKNSQIVTEAIIAFSKKLGSKTVVEYVHNKEVYNKVKELNADFSQGFYLGEPKAKPLSIQDLTKELA